MTVSEFLAQLPDDFFAHLSEASLENIIQGLPDPLFKRLVEAVRRRLNNSTSKYPTDKEWMLWHSGQRIPAIRTHRERTGAGIRDSKEMFERGRLDAIVNSIFFDDEDEGKEGECMSSA